MFHFIINSKNYVEASGDNLTELASAIAEVAAESAAIGRIGYYLASPAFSISELSKSFPNLPIFAQHLDAVGVGSTTGHLVAQIAEISGAKGSLINHSEHRIPVDTIKKVVDDMRKLKMTSVVCAKDPEEVGVLALMKPDFIAIEPPELIGSGRAVSKVKPELITNSIKALENSRQQGQTTALLCGAGIVNEEDVKKAAELGTHGILVASGIIKATNWRSKIRSLSSGFD